MTPDEEAALAANERFYQAFAMHDFPAMDALWARRSAVRCTHPGWMTLEGREDVLGSWQAIIANPGQARVVPGAAEAQVFGEVALVYCREFVAGSALVATNVFVREDGEWRLLHHHSSPVAMG